MTYWLGSSCIFWIPFGNMGMLFVSMLPSGQFSTELCATQQPCGKSQFEDGRGLGLEAIMTS